MNNNQKRYYDSIEEIKKDFSEKKLIGKMPTDLSQTEYHRVYRFARFHKISLPVLWKQIGMILGRESTEKTMDGFVVWASNNEIIGKKYSEISQNKRLRMKAFAKNMKMELVDLYKKLGINTDEEFYYSSIDEIREDLQKKGLVGKKPNDVIMYDGSATFMNIQRFVSRKNLSLSNLWPVIGITYSDRVEICNGKPKAKFAYYSIEEIKTDLIQNNLVGISPRQLQEYDATRTYANIVKFAKRANIKLVDIWEQIGIVPLTTRKESEPRPIFSSVEDIKVYLKDNGFEDADLKKIRIQDKRGYEAILDFARDKKLNRGDIWKQIGIQSALLALNSMEDVTSLLKQHNLLTNVRLGDIRKNERVHDAICNFAKKKGYKTSVVWGLLGIKNAYQE